MTFTKENIEQIIDNNEYNLFFQMNQKENVTLLKHLLKKAKSNQLNINNTHNRKILEVALESTKENYIKEEFVERIAEIYKHPLRKALEDTTSFMYGLIVSGIHAWQFTPGIKAKHKAEHFFKEKYEKSLIGKIGCYSYAIK